MRSLPRVAAAPRPVNGYPPHLRISSARSSSDGGIVRPNTVARFVALMGVTERTGSAMVGTRIVGQRVEGKRASDDAVTPSSAPAPGSAGPRVAAQPEAGRAVEQVIP